MNRELSRVSLLLVCMFVALFGSSSIIQWAQADQLRDDPNNRRTILDSFAAERGAILVDGVPVAQSVESGDQYEWQRVYPQGALYAPVTGYYSLGQGNSGIEGAMNDELTGQASSQFLQQVEQLITGQDPSGSSVELTIDPAAQQAATDALAAVQGATGAAVAIDPATGDILALTTTPTYDPNIFASHDTDAVIAAYDQMLADPSQPLQNRAIGGDLYFPGSVFKLVVTAAAIESGSYTPDSTFGNPAELDLTGTSTPIYNSTRQACRGGEGDQVSLTNALIYSCNIPFAELGEQLGEDAIAEQAAAFGYGESLQIPMSVTPSTYPEDLDPAQLQLTSFGQYDVRVTPLQVAMTTAAIANDGELMQPQLVDEVIDTETLDVLAEPAPQSLGQAVSESTAQTMQDLMVQGVQQGLASNAAIPGVTVGGKTGTAENDESGDRPFNLWFTGFAEGADGSQVAVAVVVVPQQNIAADTSNEVAAPIGRAIIEAVLNS
ncbi:peptidoglycan D,D-transpeptidase FtsI family protein [Agrococcus sp. SGAir0287]|uniref:peptidoglycan D,D-transpeptidase FtsI family protein n=1 Tax=Agrococcus sp. SGAir0287 TaxID=2070347 RepID=UPI0010CCF5CC|nr:penicillin-binding protein 2 [Agrococcus sp. SGAir0287]QCR18050.1 cell division protein FtsI [Agrococcus sp. SGAir0287]